MMQVTDTPMTSRVETPNRIPVITISKKSWFPLATGELVIGITLPLDGEIVVDGLCVRLWMFIVGVCVVVGVCLVVGVCVVVDVCVVVGIDPLVGLVGIAEEGHV